MSTLRQTLKQAKPPSCKIPLNSSPKAKIQILSEGAAIPTGVEVKHVKNYTREKVVISVDPCDDVKPAEELAVIPQSVEPSVNPAALPPGEQELVDGSWKEQIHLRWHVGGWFGGAHEEGYEILWLSERSNESRNHKSNYCATNHFDWRIWWTETFLDRKAYRNQIRRSERSDVFYACFVQISKERFCNRANRKVDDKPVSENLFKVLDAMNSFSFSWSRNPKRKYRRLPNFRWFAGKLPVAVKRTFMEHAWNFIVAIGSTENSFEEWDTLKLARSLMKNWGAFLHLQ